MMMRIDSTKKLIFALIGGALGFCLPEIVDFITGLFG